MKQMIWSSYDLLDETAKEGKHSINSPFHSKNVILLL